MLEAAIRQYGERVDIDEQRVLMAAAARYLAAKPPTQREMLQTLCIALPPLYSAHAPLRAPMTETPVFSERHRLQRLPTSTRFPSGGPCAGYRILHVRAH